MTPSTVSRMGRPPAYTPEQDTIILSMTRSADIIDRFHRLGYKGDFSPKALAARRQYLKRAGYEPSTAPEPEQRLAGLIARRRGLVVERKRQEQQLRELDETLQRVQDLIDKYIEEVQAPED